MITSHRLFALLFLLCGMTLIGPHALSNVQAQGSDEDLPVYRPPVGAAEKTRIGGASRGIADEVTLNVLAPEHTGLTAHGQPTLYWHLSKDWGARVELSILDEDSIDPLFERALKVKPGGGIEAMVLEDYGVMLKPDIEYEWSVTVIPETDDSGDLFASGTIRRVETPPGLEQKIKASGPSAAKVYAQEGLWYETVMALSKQIESSPKNRKLRERRAKLLEQVGLHDVATFDRK